MSTAPSSVQDAPRSETPAAPAPTLILAGVSRRYGAVRALEDVSLAVAPGEIVCLLGPSGSGKSTLLRLVAGIERPTAGRIVLEGVEVGGDRTFVEPEQRRVGLVFQDYALFPHLTVWANVAFGLRGQGGTAIARRVEAMLDRVGLRRHADSYPHTLSGGERQRVALARALAPSPRLLLLDEPFSSLDGRLRDRVRQETLDLLRETGTTAIIVTHDAGEALRTADRIALLHQGRLVQCGHPEDLYTRPDTVEAARFFSDVNELYGVCQGGAVRTPIGTFAAPRLAERARACVCIRPQHLHAASAGPGVPARVLTTAFLGESVLLSVAVSGVDAPLMLRVPGHARLAPGETVYLDVDPRDVLVVACDEEARPTPLDGGTP